MLETRQSVLTFYGGVGTPTGSNFVLNLGEKTVMVDCGFFQGETGAHEANYKPFLYDPKTIDVLLVTHAHLDHVGRIPKLVREGFTGFIYSTPETKSIATLLFEDGVSIMRHEKRRSGSEPLYTERDVAKTLSLWKSVPYYEKTEIGDEAFFIFRDAGHILGSSIIEITRGNRKIVFSGDLGNSPAPLLRDTDKVADANYILLESVYGNKQHESTEDRAMILEDIIEHTVSNRGVLMIPAFSIERTQTLLYEINNLVEKGKVPPVPVFLDSPLGIRVTEVYKSGAAHFNKATQHIIASGDDIFHFPNFHMTQSVGDSRAIASAPSPKIIIAGSGMSEGGRISYHEKRYLEGENNTLLIVGYQGAGTTGRQLQEGAKTIEVDGKTVNVRARVETLFSYSAHRDSEGLLEFVEPSAHTVDMVFVVLGEPSSSMFLAQRLRDYVGVNVSVPGLGEGVTLNL